MRNTGRTRVLGALTGFVVAALALAAPARADVDLWPLLELSNDSTTVLYPFYVHEGNFLMMFPFYYRTNEGRDHHVLWPLVKVSEGRLTRVAPIWFSSDPDQFVLLPIVIRNGSGTYFFVPPTYLSKDGNLQAVLPFYLRSWRSPTSDALWIGWRLFGWDRDDASVDYFAGYLFDYGTGEQSWHASMFPLLWTWGGEKGGGFVLPPAYAVRSDRESVTGLFPFWHSSREGDATRLWLMGYWSSHDGHSDSTAVYPFFATSTSEAAGDTTQGLSILWPLYRREETTSSSGELLRRYRRFLVFSDEVSHGHREFSLFGFIIREGTE